MVPLDTLLVDVRCWLQLWRERLNPMTYVRALRARLWYAHDWQWVVGEQRWCCMRCGAVWALGRPPPASKWPCPVYIHQDAPRGRVTVRAEGIEGEDPDG